MLPDVINIKRNPTGYIAAASAVYAAALMISNAAHHHGVIDTPTIIAAVTAVSALLTRQIVTPVAQPRDGNGNALVPALAQDAMTPSNVTVVPPAVIGIPSVTESGSTYSPGPAGGAPGTIPSGSGAPEKGLP